MKKEDKIIKICELLISMKDNVTIKDLDFSLKEIRMLKKEVTKNE